MDSTIHTVELKALVWDIIINLIPYYVRVRVSSSYEYECNTLYPTFCSVTLNRIKSTIVPVL